MKNIRSLLLEVIAELSQSYGSDNLQSGTVLQAVQKRVGNGFATKELQQEVLSEWHDLFRTGYLAWGIDFMNEKPPWFHVTKTGQRSLAQLGRDPANPIGYMAHLANETVLSPIAQSYIKEAVECYVQGLYKSSVVMVGCATESIVLEIRDALILNLQATGQPISKNLSDWKVKAVSDELKKFFDGQKTQMGHDLFQDYESYWSAFLQPIRSARNDAGHPNSVDPISGDAAHATLLIFPEVARLGKRLMDWLK